MAAGDVAVGPFGRPLTPGTPTTSDYLPAGTSMLGKFDQSLSTEAKAGESFTVTVNQTVYAADNTVAIPAGAVLHGVVTGTHTSAGPNDRNFIRVTFDELRMNGHMHAISGRVSDITPGVVVSGAELSRVLTTGRLEPGTGTVIALGVGDAATPGKIPAGSSVTVLATQGVRIR